MVKPKKRAILYASASDAVYLPTSMEMIVYRMVPTASANCSCEIFFSFRSSFIFVSNDTSWKYAKPALQTWYNANWRMSSALCKKTFSRVRFVNGIVNACNRTGTGRVIWKWILFFEKTAIIIANYAGFEALEDDRNISRSCAILQSRHIEETDCLHKIIESSFSNKNLFTYMLYDCIIKETRCWKKEARRD